MKPEKQTVKALKRKAWKLMSEYIRRKHADRNGNCCCFTCGAIMPWREAQAGHGIPGRGSYILYMEQVIYPQCPRCNVWKGGVYDVFIPKLIKKHGLDWYEEHVRNSKRPLKRTKSDYVDLVYELEDKLKDLTSQ